MSLIIVGKPEIETVDKKARLSVTLQGGSAASLFFEVDEKYRQYLCTEDSDAFLLILIEYAQQKPSVRSSNHGHFAGLC